MDEDFLTEGIKNDRYLKAVKLVNKFENEIYDEIRNVFDEFVENSDLFKEDGSPDERNKPTRGYATLATHRIDYYTARVQEKEEDPDKMIVSVGFEWVNPAEQNEEVSNGESLTYVYYKIKNASEENYGKVCEKTKNPDIMFGEELWRLAPGIFYVIVEDREDIREGLRALRDHLSRFGEEFGVER